MVGEVTIYGSIPENVVTSQATLYSFPTKKIDVSSERPKVFGLGFPSGSKTGVYFNKEAGIELLKNNIKQMIHTERGERVMLPGFGCGLQQHLFQPMDDDLISRIKFEIVSSFNNYMPFVEILKLNVFALEGYGVEDYNAMKIQLVCKRVDKDESPFNIETVVK